MTGAEQAQTRIARDDFGDRTSFEEIEVGADLGSMQFCISQDQVDAVCARNNDSADWQVQKDDQGNAIVPVFFTYVPPRALFSMKYNVRGLAYKWEIKNFKPLLVGTEITVTAKITDKWSKNDREYVAYEAEFRDEEGALLMSSRRGHVIDFIPATAPRSGTAPATLPVSAPDANEVSS